VKAMRLSPLDALMFNMQGGAALAHFLAGRYDQASAVAEQALRIRSDYGTGLRVLAASRALTGRQADAQKAVARLRQLDPASRISNLRDRVPLRQPEDLARFEGGLRKAGLSEYQVTHFGFWHKCEVREHGLLRRLWGVKRTSGGGSQMAISEYTP